MDGTLFYEDWTTRPFGAKKVIAKIVEDVMLSFAKHLSANVPGETLRSAQGDSGSFIPRGRLLS
jgi:hypothetical protein